MAERVGESAVQQLCHAGTFFVGKSGAAAVSGWILEVDFLVGHIHVAAYYHRLTGIEAKEILAESGLPFHAVVKAQQTVL